MKVKIPQSGLCAPGRLSIRFIYQGLTKGQRRGMAASRARMAGAAGTRPSAPGLGAQASAERRGAPYVPAI
jgi:hypothetical protein